MNLKRANLPPQDSFQKLLEMTESEFLECTRAFLTFTRVHTHNIETERSGAEYMTIRCGTAGNAKRKCGTRVLETFQVFPSFSRLDMKN